MSVSDESPPTGLLGERVIVHPANESSFSELDGTIGTIVRVEQGHLGVLIDGYGCTIGIPLSRVSFLDREAFEPLPPAPDQH